MVSELSLPKPGGMCYHHNLTGPKDGPRTSWAEGKHGNSLQRDGLGASPPLPQGLPPGNRHAAPIMFCMIGAALRLSVYLCVSRIEAFLLASNTSYLK
jgi:hypothetical protein